MKRRKTLFIHLYRFRSLIKRFAIIFVFIASFIVIMLNKTENVFLDKTSLYVTDVASPLLEVVLFPAKIWAKGYDKFIEFKNTYEDNQKLLRDSHELVVLKNEMAALRLENNLLSNLLNYQKTPKEKYITARIIAEEENAFSQSLIVYIGSNNVKKGQIVLSDKGVVGRVESVGLFYAKILQITDINSRVPVSLQNSSLRAILVGDNTSYPYLEFLPIGAKVNVGDNVVTSGVAGVFPSGLVVGKVFKVDKNSVKIKLASDVDALEYVKIVDYEL